MTITNQQGRGPMEYIDWLKARIDHAIVTGELWMIDGLAIARAWTTEEGAAG